MIKFFRKIRQALLSESKFRKYFIYALGEIVLVVIGILIALQINNLNEERKASKKEQFILKDLRKDLESNSTILKEDIASNINIISNATYILKHFENELVYSDSLSEILPQMAWASQLTLVSSAFSSLKSSGFDVIRSNDLRLQIIQLFDQEYQSVTQWLNTINIEKYKEFRKEFTAFPRGGISENYKEILKNDNLYNLLHTYRGYKESSIERERELLDNTEELIKRINTEIIH